MNGDVFLHTPGNVFPTWTACFLFQVIQLRQRVIQPFFQFGKGMAIQQVYPADDGGIAFILGRKSVQRIRNVADQRIKPRFEKPCLIHRRSAVRAIQFFQNSLCFFKIFSCQALTEGAFPFSQPRIGGGRINDWKQVLKES